VLVFNILAVIPIYIQIFPNTLLVSKDAPCNVCIRNLIARACVCSPLQTTLLCVSLFCGSLYVILLDFDLWSPACVSLYLLVYVRILYSVNLNHVYSAFSNNAANCTPSHMFAIIPCSKYHVRFTRSLGVHFNLTPRVRNRCHLSRILKYIYRVSDSWGTKWKVVIDWDKLRRKVLYHFAKFAIIIK